MSQIFGRIAKRVFVVLIIACIGVNTTLAASIDVRISASSDDAEEFLAGDIYLDSSDLELVTDDAEQKVGLRFRNITIPPGSTVTNAYIQFKVDEASSENTVLTIKAEDTNNASTFAGNGNISARTLTSASVNWVPPAWTTVGQAQTGQRTPNLSSVIQEVVSRSGWSSGNAIAFVITGSGTRVAEAYDGDSAGAPLLHIEYSTVSDTTAPSTPTNLNATAVSSRQINLTWNASSDNIGVSGYDVYRNGSLVGTVTGTSFSNTGLSSNTGYTYTVRARDASGNVSNNSQSASATTLPQGATVTVMAGGDIGESGGSQQLTANLIEAVDPDAVLMLGDGAYPDGTLSEFNSYYDPSWGSFKDITYPTPGNHEYHLPDAEGYFDYFGSRAPAEYYSFDLGDWHLISLNTNISTSNSSAQVQWLIDDLANNNSSCVLAYAHAPAYSSGTHGQSATALNLFEVLYDNGVTLYLSGHDHLYERFAPQDANGNAEPSQGIRSFVVGAGGSELYSFGPLMDNSEARNSTDFGLLKLELGDDTYAWEFMSAAGGSFTDMGTGSCVGTGSSGDTTAPSTPTNLSATAVSSSQINLAWNASSDNVGVSGYDVFRDGTFVAATLGTSFTNSNLTANTTYSYTVRARDAAGNTSSQSASAQATTQSTPTGGTTYYVDTNNVSASDSNPGTEASPWKTIHKAAATLTAGDTVYVKQGTYTGSVQPARSGTAGNPITYSAYPGQERLVVINGAGFFVEQKSYITINGFKVQNVPAGGYDHGRGISFIGPAEGIVVTNNHTYDTYSSGIAIWGVAWGDDPTVYNYEGLRNVLVEGNRVEMAVNGGYNEDITVGNGVVDFVIKNNLVINGGEPIGGNGLGIDVKEGANNGEIVGNELTNVARSGIYLDGGRGGANGYGEYEAPVVQNIKIHDNYIHDSNRGGIAISTEGWGHVRDIDIYNNIVTGMELEGIEIYNHPDVTGTIKDVRIVNNTLYNNGHKGIIIYHPEAENITIRNNIAYANASSPDIALSYVGPNPVVDHNLTTDPHFIDAANHNFRLQSDSTAIDAGSATLAPTLDYYGTNRPQGSAVDIGAVEYGGSGTTSNFPAGSRVETTDILNVRDPYGLSGSLLGTQPAGAVGTVLNVSPASADGYIWIPVDFDSGVDGWVAEQFLTLYNTPTPVLGCTDPAASNYNPSATQDDGSCTYPPQDTDGDNVPDSTDNCPNTVNPDQTDTDGDGVGDACDATPNGDVTAPTLSSITVSGIGQSSATISWSTDELATSEVLYGTTNSYGNTTGETSTVSTSHSETLAGLAPDTTYHFQVSSRDASGNAAASQDMTFTTLTAPDTTDPSVTITSPSNGATVEEVITITADANDPSASGQSTTGVASVRFSLDGNTLSTDTSAPYDTGLDTTTLSNGVYTITALATDGAGNTDTDSITITVSNVTTPPVDTTAPEITFIDNVTTSNDPITQVITFETDEPATSVLRFGTNRNNLNNSVANTDLTTTHTFTLTGLSNKTTYYFALTATDVAGNSDTTSVDSFRTIGKPQKVSNLTARSGSIILEWDALTDDNVDEIVVIRRNGNATAKTSDKPLATLDSDVTTYTDETAKDNKKYTYTLYTVSGGVYSDPTTITFTHKSDDTPELTSKAQAEAKAEARSRSGGGGSDRSKSNTTTNNTSVNTSSHNRIRTTDNLNVRLTPNGNLVRVIPNGTLGIKSTDTPIQKGGHTWIKVEFADGVSGWVAENFTRPETTVSSDRHNQILSQIQQLLAQISVLQEKLKLIRGN
ncbi:metallophosphoesterase [Candidatus Kaiserbacteria bacterium]|nr:metallophosphoesterase [Candidatus Kaiserbacteria bacterium]